MSEDSVREYPYLAALIGGWFHQDFDVEGETLDEVVGAFKRSSPQHDSEGAKADIERFLKARNDRELEADFVAIFQPDVDAAGWGMTTRTWLETIARLLSAG